MIKSEFTLLRINNIVRKDDRSADLDAEFNWLIAKGSLWLASSVD